jgi:hypothetical protein
LRDRVEQDGAKRKQASQQGTDFHVVSLVLSAALTGATIADIDGDVAGIR